MTLRLPVGWARSSDPGLLARSATDGTVDLVLAGPAQSSGVEPTIRVVTVKDGPVPPAEVKGYLTSVASHGATNVGTVGAATVAGESATTITYDHNLAGVAGRSRDLVVTHAGITYDVVLDCTTNDFASDDAVLTAVLGSWHWSN